MALLLTKFVSREDTLYVDVDARKIYGAESITECELPQMQYQPCQGFNDTEHQEFQAALIRAGFDQRNRAEFDRRIARGRPIGYGPRYEPYKTPPRPRNTKTLDEILASCAKLHEEPADDNKKIEEYNKKIEEYKKKRACMKECRMQKEDAAIVEEAASRVMCVN
jgi:hypothetical protein